MVFVTSRAATFLQIAYMLGADKTARVRRLVCTFGVRMQQIRFSCVKANNVFTMGEYQIDFFQVYRQPALSTTVLGVIPQFNCKPTYAASLNMTNWKVIQFQRQVNASLLICLFVCFFIALRPKSTSMIMAGRSVQLTTLFPGQAGTTS